MRKECVSEWEVREIIKEVKKKRDKTKDNVFLVSFISFLNLCVSGLVLMALSDPLHFNNGIIILTSMTSLSISVIFVFYVAEKYDEEYYQSW